MAHDSSAPLPDEVFRSRVDAWLVVLVVGVLVAGLWLAMTGPSSRAGLGKGAGVAIMWHIAYRDITSVRLSHNPLSAPALSLRRLEIRYGKHAWVLISPRDRDAFIASLRRRVPGLEVKA